jgi:hypothetical protein
MNTKEPRIDISCQQVLVYDASVFSIQWIVLPGRHASTLTPEYILERYFSYLRSFTLSLVRPQRTDNGLEFRFLNSKLHLLAFAKPVYSDEAVRRSVTLHICGGPFVQSDRCDRGAFSFISEKSDGGIKVTVQLSEYHPRLLGSSTPGRLRKTLYRLTQAYIHKLVTTRFLAALYLGLEGEMPSFRIVSAHVQDGEEI